MQIAAFLIEVFSTCHVTRVTSDENAAEAMGICDFRFTIDNFQPRMNTKGHLFAGFVPIWQMPRRAGGKVRKTGERYYSLNSNSDVSALLPLTLAAFLKVTFTCPSGGQSILLPFSSSSIVRICNRG